MGRLNVAYWKNGIPLLSETISNYYSVHIDRYVLVNFYSFIDVVDEIGGLDMDVDNDEFAAINEAVREHNKYLKNPPEKDYVKQPGKQHLNGNQALAYARIRQGCGDDYGRTERQRETITAIINKMKSLNNLNIFQHHIYYILFYNNLEQYLQDIEYMKLNHLQMNNNLLDIHNILQNLKNLNIYLVHIYYILFDNN